MSKTKQILNSFTCESVLIYYRAWERLNKSYDINFSELCNLIELKHEKKIIRKTNKELYYIYNSLHRKKLTNKISGLKYNISDLGYMCLKKFSRNLSQIIYENSGSLETLTEL